MLILGGVQKAAPKAPLGGFASLPPEIASFASSTQFLVPNALSAVPGADVGKLFGTSTFRIYLRIQATSTVPIGLSFNDTPCTLDSYSVRLHGAGAGTSTSVFELTPDAPYKGTIRVCGLSGTTSVTAIQGVIR